MTRKKLNPLVALIVQATPRTTIAPQPRIRMFTSRAKYLAPQSPQILFPYVQSIYMNATYVSNTN